MRNFGRSETRNDYFVVHTISVQVWVRDLCLYIMPNCSSTIKPHEHIKTAEKTGRFSSGTKLGCKFLYKYNVSRYRPGVVFFANYNWASGNLIFLCLRGLAWKVQARDLALETEEKIIIYCLLYVSIKSARNAQLANWKISHELWYTHLLMFRSFFLVFLFFSSNDVRNTHFCSRLML